MRKIISTLGSTILLARWLLIPVASAKSDDENNSPVVTQTESKLDTVRTDDASQGAPAPTSDIVLELKEVKQLLQAQQEQIETLKAELRIVRGNSAAKVDTDPAEAKTAETKTQKQEDIGKKLQIIENKLKNVGPFSFGGDFRLRDESFFGGPVKPIAGSSSGKTQAAVQRKCEIE